jgi:hypothetical protein
MIRALIAQTNEIDEADLAVVNLLAQLELPQNLLRYSVGIVFAHVESLDEGLLEALAQALPFPMTGVSVPLTSSQTDKVGFSLLTLTVLTSNDVVFSASLSEPLEDDDEQQAEKFGEALWASHGGQRPKLGLLFGPPNNHSLQADAMVEGLSKAMPGCNFFGGVAGDYTTSSTPPGLIFGGRTYLNRYSVILLFGLVRPKFSLINIPERRALKHRAIVSRCEGNRVMEVNGVPITEYLGKLGMLPAEKTISIHVPFLVTDSSARTRIIMLESILPDGTGQFSRSMPPNSTLGLAGFDETDVLRTARELTDEIKWETFDFCFIQSCLARSIVLGLNYLSEFNLFKSELGDLQPYILYYSGGEFCPVLEDDGETVNKFHNMVLASCRF